MALCAAREEAKGKQWVWSINYVINGLRTAISAFRKGFNLLCVACDEWLNGFYT